jgi:hypothetical protein
VGAAGVGTGAGIREAPARGVFVADVPGYIELWGEGEWGGGDWVGGEGVCRA